MPYKNAASLCQSMCERKRERADLHLFAGVHLSACVCVFAPVYVQVRIKRATPETSERERHRKRKRERAFLFIFCGCTTLLPSSFCSVCRQICISQIPIRAWRRGWRWGRGCGNDCNDCNEMGVAGRQDKVAMPRL